jgi:hypothetical protein
VLRRSVFTIAPLLAIVNLAAASEPKLVLLGTAGRPTPKRTRSAPSQAIQIEDSIYVADCGNGVGGQMVLAGLPLRDLRHVFVTYHLSLAKTPSALKLNGLHTA